VNKREVDAFPVNLEQLAERNVGNLLESLAKALMVDISNNSTSRTMKFAHDTLQVQCIIPKLSKAIIDEIDSALAEHYCFTGEELDFVVNYDIKYRMG
jgi:hypothetical protein